MHGLILLTDIPLKVQKASVKLGLNKAQTKALARLEQASGNVFHEITQKGLILFKDQNNHLQAKIELKEFSTRKNQELFKQIHHEFKNGTSIPDMAQKYGAPQTMVWSVILEEKTEQDILSAHLALTVLLLEAAYADGDCSREEKEHLVATLVTNFGISRQEIDTLLADRDKENSFHEIFRDRVIVKNMVS